MSTQTGEFLPGFYPKPNSERATIAPEVVEELAQKAHARYDEYYASYRHSREDAAPAADLCSAILHEYRQSINVEEDHFKQGATFLVLKRLRELRGA